MFNNKQKQLFIIGKSQGTSVVSPFLKAGMEKSAETKSGNGATKYKETDNAFVTQFGSIGSYKAPRSFQDITNDQATLWAINPRLAICFILFLRTITRIVQLFNGVKTETTQRGAGLKHESIMRMIWLGVNHPESFKKNIGLFISVGSWKDIFQMMSYDLQYHGWKDKLLDFDFMSTLILVGLNNESTRQLILKYLPQIKARSKCTTVEAQANCEIAKFLCFKMFDDGSKGGAKQYAQYRKLKSSGTAHVWQQLISKKLLDQINFDTIHGRALAQLVGSKFLANHGLGDKYQQWISSKPIAKFTGYVYELASKIETANQKYQLDTINAQFEQLLATAGKSNSNFIVVKDTSLSMNHLAIGTNMTSYHVAKSLSIFFARMLSGHFAGHYIDFSSTAILRAIKGSNFVEHWQTEKREASANTNFLGVAELFADIRESGIAEDQFPNGIILISDGEFDNTGMVENTNLAAFTSILAQSSFSRNFIDNFTFVFWDIRNNFYSKFANTKFETFDTGIKNVFYFGGFDPSVITFLTGVEGKETTKVPTNATELFEAAMSQEVLNMVQV